MISERLKARRQQIRVRKGTTMCDFLFKPPSLSLHPSSEATEASHYPHKKIRPCNRRNV